MPSVAISRGTRCGGSDVARSLSERLGIRQVTGDDLLASIRSQGAFAREVVASIGYALGDPGGFARYRRPYVVLLRAALLREMRQRDLVYHAYSSPLLMPRAPHGLRVRVDASVRRRMDALQASGLTSAEAQEWVRSKDAERLRWSRLLHGCDVSDPSHYDLCVSLETSGVEGICDRIVEVLEGPAYRADAEQRAGLLDLCLAAEVEAALVTDPRFRELDVTANAERRHVVVEGPSLPAGTESALLATVRGTREVATARYGVRLRPPAPGRSACATPGGTPPRPVAGEGADAAGRGACPV